MALEIGLLLLLLLVVGWNILFPKRFDRRDEEIRLYPDPTTRELDDVLTWAAQVADARRKGQCRGGRIIVSVPSGAALDDYGAMALDWLKKNGAAQRVYLVEADGEDQGIP